MIVGVPVGHKKVTITITTFIPGVKGAVKASDGMTTHTIDAFIQVDKIGNPVAVCEGPDYEGFVRSFGIDDLQYGVLIHDGVFVILVYLDDDHSLELHLNRDDLRVNPGEPLKIDKLNIFNRPAHWCYKVCAERHAGAVKDVLKCDHTRTHTEEIRALPPRAQKLI